ncbi:MAG: DUF2975 domain-containing protein [Bacteroides sp.]
MKRRLNILCVLVILTLSYSVLETCYYLLIGFRAGIEMAVDEKTHLGEVEKIKNLKTIHLLPDVISMEGGELLRDSVYNARSGTYEPAAFATLCVSVPAESRWTNFWVGILTIIQLICLIKATLFFIRLIVDINRSLIFCWKNVSRLRRLGILLLVSFGCNFLSEYLNLQVMQEVFELPGYAISMREALSVTIPVLGLCALIVAEVFAIGLKMKEEQDLTI